MGGGALTAADAFMDAAAALQARVRAQRGAVEDASRRCSAAIARGDLVHLFGSGHSRMAVEEIWPRYGSFPGFHPMVELSLTNHHQVVGSNGQRQALLLENTPGLAAVILRNFRLSRNDVMIVFSASGTTVVPVEIAALARAQGLYTIGVISVAYCRASRPRTQDGRTLLDVVDAVIDNGAPPGDAMVQVPGVRWPVGPGSTLGNTLIAGALKCRVAELLAEAGRPPIVLTSACLAGPEESARLFDAAYDDHRDRVQRL